MATITGAAAVPTTLPLPVPTATGAAGKPASAAPVGDTLALSTAKKIAPVETCQPAAPWATFGKQLAFTGFSVGAAALIGWQVLPLGPAGWAAGGLAIACLAALNYFLVPMIAKGS